jgi:Alcohol dehydrogenase GroES-like domain
MLSTEPLLNYLQGKCCLWAAVMIPTPEGGQCGSPHPTTTPATMRAIGVTEFGGPEVLRLLTTARPQPLPGDVLVRVHAPGVNPVDWKTRAGAPTPAAAALGQAPHILGWDVSGVVEQVGPGVHLFAPGDEVYGLPWFPRPGRRLRGVRHRARPPVRA